MPADGPAAAALLRGVDRAAFAVSLSVRLRQHGVPVGLTGTEDFTRALGVTGTHTTTSLYWTARVALVRRLSEVPAFDAVFDAAFRDATLEVDPHARRGPGARCAVRRHPPAGPEGRGRPGCRGGSAVGHAAARGVDGR